jgi:hypothetical protein
VEPVGDALYDVNRRPLVLSRDVLADARRRHLAAACDVRGGELRRTVGEVPDQVEEAPEVAVGASPHDIRTVANDDREI